jgi:hypothetical protein
LLALNDDDDDETSGKKSLLIIGGAGGVGSWTISPARAWHPSLEITVTASTTERVDTTRRNISQRLPLPGAGADGSGGRHRMSGGAPTPDLFGSCADIIRSNGSMCLVVAGKSYLIRTKVVKLG